MLDPVKWLSERIVEMPLPLAKGQLPWNVRAHEIYSDYLHAAGSDGFADKTTFWQAMKTVAPGCYIYRNQVESRFCNVRYLRNEKELTYG